MRGDDERRGTVVGSLVHPRSPRRQSPAQLRKGFRARKKSPTCKEMLPPRSLPIILAYSCRVVVRWFTLAPRAVRVLPSVEDLECVVFWVQCVGCGE